MLKYLAVLMIVTHASIVFIYKVLANVDSCIKSKTAYHMIRLKTFFLFVIFVTK